MQVRFTMHKGYVTGRPVDDADNERIIEGMRANGWPHGDGVEPYFSQGREALADDIAALTEDHASQVAMLYAHGNIEIDADEWTFRHLCGYQSD